VSGDQADKPRLRARGGISIQSKLLIMLLGVSVVSSVIVGVIGYTSGTDSLRQAALDRLTALRVSRANAVDTYVKTTSDSLVLYTRGRTAIDAVTDFSSGFEQLQSDPVAPEVSAAVNDYYSGTFVPELEKRSGESSAPAAFEPTGSAEQYLQYHYTVPFTDFDKAIKNDDAGDGSAWSAANARYNDYFREIVTRAGFDDALLLDTSGNVVYSAYKGVDLGTNVRTGPYKGTSLASNYEKVLASNSVDYVGVSDFERYQPSLDVPTLWIESPIGENGVVSGVLALQVPLDSINAIMTDNQHWKTDGLGTTGEVYLAGPDKLMRSVSRELVQHPKQYVRDAVAAGTPPAVAARAVAVKGTTLLQPVNTAAVNAALRGKSSTSVSIGYLGGENLTSYAPLHISGLDWVIVARLDTSEAFAPVAAFTRVLVLSTAGLVLVVALLSLLLAQVFVRPLRRLMVAVRRVAAGDRDVVVDTGSRDEFADVGVALNDMSRSLQVKADLLEAQQDENERLLLSLMPPGVAKRYRQGDETIAEDHQDVSVIFADIVGFEEYSRGMGSEESLAALNGIVRSFDDAGEKLGIEKVRTNRQGYLASCGLIVPRVDDARRVVEFAVELQRILRRYSDQHDARLTLRAGIDSGTVTSGLVGQSSVVYDMWGDAVSLAHRVQGAGQESGIFLTQRTVDKLPDTFTFADSGTVTMQDGEQRVWRIDTEVAHA
jgi:class 3 adenylate cyclase